MYLNRKTFEETIPESVRQLSQSGAAEGMGAMVEINLSDGTSFTVKRILSVADETVTLEVYPVREIRSQPDKTLFRGDHIILPYQTITRVRITDEKPQDRRIGRMGFSL